MAKSSFTSLQVIKKALNGFNAKCVGYKLFKRIFESFDELKVVVDLLRMSIEFVLFNL